MVLVGCGWGVCWCALFRFVGGLVCGCLLCVFDVLGGCYWFALLIAFADVCFMLLCCAWGWFDSVFVCLCSRLGWLYCGCGFVVTSW